jgi:hypothetical protein
VLHFLLILLVLVADRKKISKQTIRNLGPIKPLLVRAREIAHNSLLTAEQYIQ